MIRGLCSAPSWSWVRRVSAPQRRSSAKGGTLPARSSGPAGPLPGRAHLARRAAGAPVSNAPACRAGPGDSSATPSGWTTGAGACSRPAIRSPTSASGWSAPVPTVAAPSVRRIPDSVVAWFSASVRRACEEGRSWGTLERAIWVDRGCRGSSRSADAGPRPGGVPHVRRFPVGSANGARASLSHRGIATGVRLDGGPEAAGGAR
jgi:hypothetical protein